jgi:hypothetical protein
VLNISEAFGQMEKDRTIGGNKIFTFEHPVELGELSKDQTTAQAAFLCHIRFLSERIGGLGL